MDADPRSRLIAAAGPIFAGRGYSGASLREIAAEAGANVASISYYFGDKMGLYRAVIQHIRRTREQQHAMPMDLVALPAPTRLSMLVRTMLSRMMACNNTGWESQVMTNEMMQPTEAFEELVKDYFQPLFTLLKQTMAELLAATHPNVKEFPEHMIEQLALSVVGQCLYYRVGNRVVEILIPQQRRQDHYNVDALSRHVIAFTLAAVANPDFHTCSNSAVNLSATNAAETSSHTGSLPVDSSDISDTHRSVS
ncbi:CerR family C-terminal domain-containing protein [Stieleria varia]|uniref:Putative HTH-type transcriptional regulator YttP n=1 Tax=Stieleria varia TaxID=2528005 RepID=A0A5C6AUH0_9BACT|nr:CerR family C-terminal domain-containing protein [Stieleria varia]TWU02662.1 putative HTH-type transcriptional regulator YttP [Stieleria varia]